MTTVKLTPAQIAASILGRIGGSKTSARKKAASKANGLKGGTTKRALRIQAEKQREHELNAVKVNHTGSL